MNSSTEESYSELAIKAMRLAQQRHAFTKNMQPRVVEALLLSLNTPGFSVLASSEILSRT